MVGSFLPVCRSAHSNAYFYGFWKNKRIVLFDTLLEEDVVPKKEDVVPKKEDVADQESKGAEEGAVKDETEGSETEEEVKDELLKEVSWEL